MNVAVITGMLEGLSEESRVSAFDYIQYLAQREGARKAEQAQRTFEKVDALLDGKPGWTNEAEMIAELAAFRRSREGL